MAGALSAVTDLTSCRRTDLRQRLGAVGDGVVPVGGDQLGEGSCGSTAGTDPGQDEAGCQGDQHTKQQPRLPPLASLCMEQHSDDGHYHLPLAVWGEIRQHTMWVTSPRHGASNTDVGWVMSVMPRCVGVLDDLAERPYEGCAQFIPGGQSELGERRVKMALNRPHGERERAGDLRIGGSLRRQQCNFALTAAEGFDLIRPGSGPYLRPFAEARDLV